MCTKGWTIECIICLIIDILILSYPPDVLFLNLDTTVNISSGVTFWRDIDHTMVLLIYFSRIPVASYIIVVF